jgi:hypothetical protein
MVFFAGSKGENMSFGLIFPLRAPWHMLIRRKETGYLLELSHFVIDLMID